MEWIARALGAFYVFAGLMVLNAIRSEIFMDKVLAALGDPPDRADRVRVSTLAAGAVLTLVGGLLLILLTRWAAPVFLLNCALQGAYLAWARKAIPATEMGDPSGRRRTVNAFVAYLGATAFVLGLLATDVLA